MFDPESAPPPVATCLCGDHLVLTCQFCGATSDPIPLGPDGPSGAEICKVCQEWIFNFDLAAGLSGPSDSEDAEIAMLYSSLQWSEYVS